MKKILLCLIILTIFFCLSGCSSSEKFEGTSIVLSDNGITIDGTSISTNYKQTVYQENDIIFYLEGQGFKYGEGTESDEHSQKEADAHTVVHITKPGNYKLSGSLSKGQIAIDLGEEAKENHNAVVNLYLDNVDINCDVAPAIIFYNVYECGTTDEDKATYNVDTTKAGANVYIMDDTENNITGSHVAKIYEEITLNDEGTEVIDSEKLHKYDAAFYSKQTMNINGGENNTGILNIVADNEGLDSELHLTINGGNINIQSGNDGINTNEDGISVTTINGGNLTINVTGETGEGDGIDSNGWLVINGGSVTAAACSTSGDAGIDSDMGIYIYGGTVNASGNMLDKIAGASQNYAVFNFAYKQTAGFTYTLKNDNNEFIFETTPANDFTYLIVSSDKLVEGNYTLWNKDAQLGHNESQFGGGRGPGGFGGKDFKPEEFETKEGETFPEMPKGERPTPPEGETFPERGKKPDDMPTLAEGETMPEHDNVPNDMPTFAEGETPSMPEDKNLIDNTMTETFKITNGGNTFNSVAIIASTY